MKRRIFTFLVIWMLVTSLLPISALALGGYFVVKGEKKYHDVFCSEICGYEIENLRWFPSYRDVKNAGFKPSECCLNDGVDYEQDGDTYLFSKDTKIQNVMELERFMGVVDGMKGSEEMYFSDGYDSGYAEGIEAGKAEAAFDTDQRIKAAKSQAEFDAYLKAFAIAAPLITYLTCCYWPNKKEAMQKQIVSLSKELDFYRSNQDETMLVMNHVAKCANTSTLDVAQMLYISYLKNMGYSEAEARAQLTRITPKQTKTK